MYRAIWSVLLVMLLLPFVASGNDELLKLQNDDGQWVIQRKNYLATGYRGLDYAEGKILMHTLDAQPASGGSPHWRGAWDTFHLRDLHGGQGGQ